MQIFLPFSPFLQRLIESLVSGTMKHIQRDFPLTKKRSVGTKPKFILFFKDLACIVKSSTTA